MEIHAQHACTHAPKTFRAWLTEMLDAEQIEDLARHGADTGWPGLTYTSDCVELFERYEEEIREALNEDAEAFGYAKMVLMSRIVFRGCGYRSLFSLVRKNGCSFMYAVRTRTRVLARTKRRISAHLRIISATFTRDSV